MELACLEILTAWYSLSWGKEAYISASRLHGIRLIKNLTPLQASAMRKSVRSRSKCVKGNLVTKAHLYLTRPLFLQNVKHRNGGDCLHSTSAPTLVLVGPWDNKPLALSFLWLHMAHPILTQVCRSSPSGGPGRGLDCRHQILFSWPMGPS
jgi:hypothetical protein